MENQQTEIKIPQVSYDGNDKKLMERIIKFKQGRFRILVFTLVGMFIGWFSYTYITDSFLVTKIIFAIPYKISEAIYVSIIGTDAGCRYDEYYSFITEFFPNSMAATFLAERITPVLIGGALFGSLAYFTGDKRVFTLSRFVKFAGCWFLLILVFMGGVYGINAKAVRDNNHLKNIYYFFVQSEIKGEAIMDERFDMMLKALEEDLTPVPDFPRNPDMEVPLGIIFAYGLRETNVMVNYKDRYLATRNGSIYSISKEFAGYIQEYYEKGTLMGETSIYMEEKTN